MAKQTLTTIKNWFRTRLKPTQAQYWDTWDSFWHKDEKIPTSTIEKLDEILVSKATNEALINVFNQLKMGSWHPEGLIFSVIPQTGETPERIMHSFGNITIHYFRDGNETVYPKIDELPTPNPEGLLGVPVFVLVDQYNASETYEVPTLRFTGAERMRFKVICDNAVVISFAIDEASILAGCTINNATGIVEFADGWLGVSTITATVEGTSSTVIIEHTIETIAYDENIVLSIPAQTYQPDEQPLYYRWFIAEEWFDLISVGIHYLYARLPKNNSELANIIVTTDLFNEGIFENHILILIGVCNSKEQGRILAMQWGGIGSPIKTTGGTAVPSIQTRWAIVSTSCLLDVNGHNTGQQEVLKKKQKLDTETGEWVDVGEETTETISNPSDCQPPAPDPFRAAVYVAESGYDASTANEVPFSANMAIQNPLKSGYNYIYFSTPTAFGKPVIKNSISKDISSQFASDGSDNKPGYQPNTVWKRQSTFLTSAKTTFNITFS
jgi:hypothetical protein